MYKLIFSKIILLRNVFTYIDVFLDVLEKFRSFLQSGEFMDYSVQRQRNNGTRGNSDRRTYITSSLINIAIINVSETVLSSRINFNRHCSNGIRVIHYFLE